MQVGSVHGLNRLGDSGLSMAEFDDLRARRYPALISPVLYEHPSASRPPHAEPRYRPTIGDPRSSALQPEAPRRWCEATDAELHVKRPSAPGNARPSDQR